MEVSVVIVVAVSRYDGDDDVGHRLGRNRVRIHGFSVSSVQHRLERLIQIKLAIIPKYGVPIKEWIL